MSASCLIELLEVSGQDPFVVLLLQGGHGHPQDALVLGRQALLHILDDAPEQLRAEQGVQVANLQCTSHHHDISQSTSKFVQWLKIYV